MKNSRFVTAQEIANNINAKVIGDKDKKIYGMALYQNSTSTDLTYIVSRNTIHTKLDTIEASVILIPPIIGFPKNKTFIVSTHDIFQSINSTTKFLIGKV